MNIKENNEINNKKNDKKEIEIKDLKIQIIKN